MKFLTPIIMICTLAIYTIAKAETIEDANNYTVNDHLWGLVQKVNPDCRFAVEAPTNEEDVRPKYERVFVEDKLGWSECNIQFNTKFETKDLQFLCKPTSYPTCTFPTFDELAAKLPELKAERIAQIEERLRMEACVARIKAIEAYWNAIWSRDHKPEWGTDAQKMQKKVCIDKDEETLSYFEAESAKLKADHDAKKAAAEAKQAKIKELKEKKGKTLAEMEELLELTL